jgi:hypothetical protein
MALAVAVAVVAIPLLTLPLLMALQVLETAVEEMAALTELVQAWQAQQTQAEAVVVQVQVQAILNGMAVMVVQVFVALPIGHKEKKWKKHLQLLKMAL